jgi:hypothetical protein
MTTPLRREMEPGGITVVSKSRISHGLTSTPMSTQSTRMDMTDSHTIAERQDGNVVGAGEYLDHIAHQDRRTGLDGGIQLASP